MSTPFDPYPSHAAADGTEEDLPQPRRSRRRAPIAIACGAAVAVAGGAALYSASAADASGGASSSGSSSTTAPKAPAGAPSGAPKGAPKAGSMPTPPKPRPHIDGTVTSVSGTQILVKDPEGFTRTIVTSGSTKYSGGLSAAPKVGTQLHAEGTVDANGTSLDATSIGTRPTPPAGGPGGPGMPGGPGQGGRGGPGARNARPPAPPASGTKPSGASSGTPSAPSTKPSSAPSS